MGIPHPKILSDSILSFVIVSLYRFPSHTHTHSNRLIDTNDPTHVQSNSTYPNSKVFQSIAKSQNDVQIYHCYSSRYYHSLDLRSLDCPRTVQRHCSRRLRKRTGCPLPNHHHQRPSQRLPHRISPAVRHRPAQGDFILPR